MLFLLQNPLHAVKVVKIKIVPDADLHMHTFYSDGEASPEELLKAAREQGLKAIAITDHETSKGAREARNLAPMYGVELIPAIEFTCYWDGYMGHSSSADIDLLGYFIDLDSPLLHEIELRLHESVKTRARGACANLREMGYEIQLDDVIETNEHFQGYLALASTLVRLGLAEPEEASDAVGQVYYNQGRSLLSIQNGIKLIHELGGVAVLAHPTIVHRDVDGEPLSELGVMDLVHAGLNGIEVYHHRLRRHHRQHFRMLAQMFNLAISGGSDEHKGPNSFRRFGTQPITLEMLEDLRSRRP